MPEITSTTLIAAVVVAVLLIGLKLIFTAQPSNSPDGTNHPEQTHPTNAGGSPMNETKSAWIRSTQSTQTVATLLNIAGFLSFIGGIGLAVMAEKGGAMFVMAGILGGVSCFAAACVLNHLRQLVLVHLAMAPKE